MGKGKKPQGKVSLPDGWWLRLNDLCQRWAEPGAPVDIYEFTKISRTSFATAKRNREMTEQLFTKLTRKVGYESHEDLLHVLAKNRPKAAVATPIPRTITLTTQRANPQWADYRDFTVEMARPWALRCSVETASPYFRFGCKLLGAEGRVFGDGSIKSNDENMIVHIGRNNWNRPALKISSADIFITSYMSGRYIEENDRLLFRAKRTVKAYLELKVDRDYSASLTINGQSAFRQIVPPTICRRIVVYAWGDREEFQVHVSDLAIEAI